MTNKKWISFKDEFPPIHIIPKQSNLISIPDKDITNMEYPLFLKNGENIFVGQFYKWELHDSVYIDLKNLSQSNSSIPYFTHWCLIDKPE